MPRWAEEKQEEENFILTSTLDMLNFLRDVRLSKKHNIKIENNMVAASLREYKASNGKTRFFSKIIDEFILGSRTRTENELIVESTEKKYVHNAKYRFQINVKCKKNISFFIAFLREQDRNIVFDFINEINDDTIMLSNKVSVGETKYYYKLIYNDLEKIKATLLKNGKYHKLSNNEKLLLDLPLILWSKQWEYGSIFMYNWFMEAGDIEMDEGLYEFMDNWEDLNIRRQEFQDFIEEHKNKKIKSTIESGQLRLYPLNDLKTYLSDDNREEIIIDSTFATKYTNFSRLSLKIGVRTNLNTPYVAHLVLSELVFYLRVLIIKMIAVLMLQIYMS